MYEPNTILWDYTCKYCKGRGHPTIEGKGHAKDCPLYNNKNVGGKK